MATVSADSQALQHLQVVTPERTLLDTQAAWVTVPGSEGEMGVLTEHASLLTTIVSGILAYQDAQGHQHSLAVHNGYAQVENNQVIVLSEYAESPDEIDMARAQAKEEELKGELARLLANKAEDAEAIANLENRIKKAQMRQQLKG